MKKGYVITGAESTGSNFISRCISQSLGNPADAWDGALFFQPTEDIKILHRSQPWGPPRRYTDYKGIAELFEGYETKYILCTRDRGFSDRSKQRRFGRSDSDLIHNYEVSTKILCEIINSGEQFFIWNYETMISLGKVYFDLLYDFLAIDIDSRKYPAVINGNEKYLIS
tara:strand:+ start:1267 stop:1773 length:507 start_codon:yes stop_codon:yes gene_type:complete